MKLWMKKLSGFVVTALLMVSLSDKACAAEIEEEKPAAPSTEIVGEAPSVLPSAPVSDSGRDEAIIILRGPTLLGA